MIVTYGKYQSRSKKCSSCHESVWFKDWIQVREFYEETPCTEFIPPTKSVRDSPKYIRICDNCLDAAISARKAYETTT